MITKRQTMSCGCFIVRENADTNHLEVLLVKPFRDRDAWGVPKGHIEPGETEVQCALREVREETGLVPEIISDHPLPSCIVRNKHEIKTVVVFMAVLRDEQPITGDGENADIRWFDIDRLPEIHHYQSEIIKEAVLRAKAHFG